MPDNYILFSEPSSSVKFYCNIQQKTMNCSELCKPISVTNDKAIYRRWWKVMHIIDGAIIVHGLTLHYHYISPSYLEELSSEYTIGKE